MLEIEIVMLILTGKELKNPAQKAGSFTYYKSLIRIFPA